ncbi:MAG: hypothetical protein ACREAA_19145 [Candidatus Polarisedimenticolia bacterium]
MSHTSFVSFVRPLVVAALMLGTVIAGAPDARSAETFPGGFVEKVTGGETRPNPSAAVLSRLLPTRGGFTFPSPWNTEGVRITNSSDCNGADCVIPVGYSYWRNMNNSAGSDTMLIFLGLGSAAGGPTLFSYNKNTDEVKKVGPLFDSSNPLSGATGEGWYFSATMPKALYLNSGSRMQRYDVSTKKMSVVFDAATQMGGGIYIWQMHSSDDDQVHVATVRSSASSAMMGCIAYREAEKRFSWFAARGTLDECHLDKAGRYLIMLDNVDGADGEDNRIIDLTTGRETTVMDRQGAAGHADTGYGYIVNEDNWSSEPGAVLLRTFNPPSTRPVYHTADWNVGVGHITHGNALPGVTPDKQFVCSSNAMRGNYPRANEIICYRLDGSMDVLVVAPVMTDLNASGGGDDYSKSPKGNMDVTGQYMLWTSNTGGNRVDAFLVKVPAHRLVSTSVVSTPKPPTGGTGGGMTLEEAKAKVLTIRGRKGVRRR